MNAIASAVPRSMTERYRTFHLWMLLPFAISIFGFSYSDCLNLAGATFHQHVHGLSAAHLSYLLVVPIGDSALVRSVLPVVFK